MNTKISKNLYGSSKQSTMPILPPKNGVVEAVLDFKNNKYRVKWAGQKLCTWMRPEKVSPSDITRFWMKRNKVMEKELKSSKKSLGQLRNANRKSMLMARKSQASLFLARKTLNSTLHRANSAWKQLEETKKVLRDSTEELVFSRSIIADLRSQKSEMEGEIIRYDAEKDVYFIKRKDTLKVQSLKTSELGTDFRRATIFWLRALKRFGPQLYV